MKKLQEKEFLNVTSNHHQQKEGDQPKKVLESGPFVVCLLIMQMKNFIDENK